jgi:hypothetical protein
MQHKFSTLSVRKTSQVHVPMSSRSVILAVLFTMLSGYIVSNDGMNDEPEGILKAAVLNWRTTLSIT